jgi:protein arginine N-methyltransferase 2
MAWERQVSPVSSLRHERARVRLTTDPTIYSVASALAELHLEDVGLNVEWHDVPIAESLREEVWKGVRRRYWELPSYRLPIARMGL